MLDFRRISATSLRIENTPWIVLAGLRDEVGKHITRASWGKAECILIWA